MGDQSSHGASRAFTALVLLALLPTVIGDCVFQYVPVLGDVGEVIAYQTYFNNSPTKDCGAFV